MLANSWAADLKSSQCGVGKELQSSWRDVTNRPERFPDLCGDHLEESLRILLEILRMNFCNVKTEQIK